MRLFHFGLLEHYYDWPVHDSYSIRNHGVSLSQVKILKPDVPPELRLKIHNF